MDENKFDVAEAIRMSIDLEKNGRKFYLEAAEKAETESGKKLFKMLAYEETVHLTTFQKMVDKMDKVDDWRELVKDYPQARQVPVFGEKAPANKVAKARTDEVEAIRIAMKQEREAIDYFDKIAHLADDEKTKKIFDFVREQEVYHYDLLQAEYDHITNTGFWFDSPEFRMDGKF
ncbi:MAG: ferritin family protein [Calditrichaeota bacterium]|nr:ferritin family protein [Calditrichota bacterium]